MGLHAAELGSAGTRECRVAELSNSTKLKLETLFGMSGGYVLDFSNATFSDFIRTSIGIEPYEKYGNLLSKARLLRAIWHGEPINNVATLNIELLERWRISKLAYGVEPMPSEMRIHDELREEFELLTGVASAVDTAFLAKDFGTVDVSLLPPTLTARAVIDARLAEIEACLRANAPLAVIFLVGSTLEGLLMELATSHSVRYLAASSAPNVRGAEKPVERWTLAELIKVSRELGVIGPDVSEHADQVRNFRNYIHPTRQLQQGFEPRMETAEIAQQVLRAALADLSRLAQP